MFFFSYPATLPKIFYLVPHSCIIRGLYYQVKACVEGSCIQSPRDIEFEHWVALFLPFVHFLVYFTLGIVFGESRVTSKLKAMIEFRKLSFSSNDIFAEGRQASSQSDHSVELSATKSTSVVHRGAGQITVNRLERNLPELER